MRISQVKTTKYLLPVQFAVADKYYCNERVNSVHCTLFICLRIKTLRKTSERLKSQQQKKQIKSLPPPVEIIFRGLFAKLGKIDIFLGK